MNIADAFWYAWPWMGLGMAVPVLVLLLATGLLRGMDCPRWRDPYWLAWAAMPAYLVHQFEEYGLNIADGNYVIIEQVFQNAGGILDLSGLPMFHFPLVNVALVWAGVPLAAWLGRRTGNPVVALGPYGFVLVNGLMHLGMTAVRGVPVAENPGFFTGVFLFLPLVALVIAVCVRRLRARRRHRGLPRRGRHRPRAARRGLRHVRPRPSRRGRARRARRPLAGRPGVAVL